MGLPPIEMISGLITGSSVLHIKVSLGKTLNPKFSLMHPLEC